MQKGEKVAVWATNVPYWVALQFATAKIGAVLITVNTNYREHELRYLLTHSECENIFLIDSLRDHDYLDTLYRIAPELRVQSRESFVCKSLPHLKRVCFLGAEKHRGMSGRVMTNADVSSDGTLILLFISDVSDKDWPDALQKAYDSLRGADDAADTLIQKSLFERE